MGREEARVYGELRKTLEAAGKPLANMDLLIAAHALAVPSVLVSSGRAFERVANLRGENWATDL